MDWRNLNEAQRNHIIQTILKWKELERVLTPNDIECYSCHAVPILRAWLNRLAITHERGFAAFGNATSYHVYNKHQSNHFLSEYMKQPLVRELMQTDVSMADVVFVAPQIGGRFPVDFVVGRYEYDVIGADSREVMRRQHPIAVQCESILGDEARHAAEADDDALRAHGFKVIRFGTEDLNDPTECGRAIERMFRPTWYWRDEKHDHPYDELLAELAKLG